MACTPNTSEICWCVEKQALSFLAPWPPSWTASWLAAARQTQHQFFSVGAFWPWIKNLEEFVQSPLVSLWDDWLRSVPIPSVHIDWGYTFSLTNLESARPAGVRRPYIRHGGISKLCHQTMYWLSLTFQMLLIAFIGRRCSSQYTKEFLSFMYFVDQHIVSHRVCSLAHTLSPLTRMLNRVIRLAPCLSVTRYVRFCLYWNPTWILDIWTMSL